MPIFRKLNQRGAGLLVFLFLMGAVGLIVTGNVAARTFGISQSGKIYFKQVKNREIQANLELIFNNPQICSFLVRVEGNNFELGSIMTPDTTVGGHRITSMTVENRTTVSPTHQRADFTVLSEGDSFVRNRNAVSVIYSQMGSHVGHCEVVPDPREACRRSGAEWIESQQRCGVCERMGGTWSVETARCQFGG